MPSILWEFLQAKFIEPRFPKWCILRFRLHSEQAMVRVFDYISLDYAMLTFLRRLPRHGGIVKRHWFPGYVFVHIDTERDHWHQLMRAPGVMEILGGPTPIGDDVFHDLRQRCPSELLKNDAETVIPAGSEVKVLDGPFCDMTGIVAASKHKTVWVEMMAFNRPVRAELRTKHVMIVG